MKNKIILSIFIILTFGIFLIPRTFAKDYNVDYFNTINYYSHIEYEDETRDLYIFSMPLYDYALNSNVDLSQGYIHATIQAFNQYGIISSSLAEAYSRDFSMYFTDNTSFSYEYMSGGLSPYYYFTTTNNNNHNSLHNYTKLYQVVYRFSFAQNAIDAYNTLKSCNINLLLYVDNTLGSVATSPNKYIPNTNDNIGGFNDRGMFQYSSMELLMEYTNSRTDVSDNFGYNLFTFKEPLLSQVASNNDRDTYQYHLIFNLNRKIGDFVNLKFAYLELEYISINGIKYSYENARQEYSFIYNNIYLYDNNSTLFVSGFDVLSSDVKDYVIDFIQFRLPDYTFKSSTYFNSNLGIKGYLSSAYIGVFDYNILEYYNRGYDKGNIDGYNRGEIDGYNRGVASNKTGFDNLMFAIGDVPIHIISSLLNFDILGFNLKGFFMGIITLLLFIRLLKWFKGGGSSE